MRTIAAVGLRRPWSRRETIRLSRSYAAVATRSKRAPSGSQSLPAPSPNNSPSSKAGPQPSNKKEKESKSSPRESALEQNVKALESIKRFKRANPTVDVWGMEMVNLDAEIPYDLRPMLYSLTAKPMFARSKFSDLWYAIKHNTSNWMKNTYSMFVMAKANAFPGRNIKLRVRTLGHILSVRNCSPQALLAPLRQVALNTYREVNASAARDHEHRVKELTSGLFQKKTIKAMRQREKNQNWTWSITSDVSDTALFPKTRKWRVPTPVEIVSIRAGEVYTESADPIFGHRLLIQALVKFDTRQKIDIVDNRGRAVNSDLAGARRVVQYLLLEKVGWYDTPWKIKDQLHKA